MDHKSAQPDDAMNPFSGARADLGKRAKATDTIIIVSAVIAALYFGHDVLVPIALAVLLSFVLAPVAAVLARLYIGRVASVLLAVTLAFAILVGLGAIIGKQVAQLSENLPEYQVVVTKKAEALRNSSFGKGLAEKAEDALKGLDSNLGKSTAPSQPAQSPGAAPPSDASLMQVEVHQPAPGPVQILQTSS
jgi:predicted PurR-regulated permease PerM